MESSFFKQRVFVVTLKTWSEWDRAHHTYARIRWSDDDGHGAEDSETLPDADGVTTIRHDTKESAIAGAIRWFEENGKPTDVLLIGIWTLAGWSHKEGYEVLRGDLRPETIREASCDA